MNGRVYDPVLGRFLSADPVVQHPYSTQGLNRYTYVNNNPLSFTDPSGFGFFSSLFKGIKKAFKAVVGGIKKALANPYVRIAVAIAAGYAASALVLYGIATTAATATTNALLAAGAAMGHATAVGAAAGAAAASSVSATILAGAAGGFAAGFVASGGDLQAAAIGGLTGAAFGFVGGAKFFGSALSGQRILAHGAIGGLRSKLQGGKFVRGFLTGAVAKIATPFSTAIGQGNPLAGALSSAAVGGTVSEIGGGKFANGALTGAYGYLFNEALTNLPDGRGDEVDQYTGRVVDVERGTRDGVIILGAMGGVVGAPVLWSAGLSGGANSVFWSGGPGAQALARSLGVSLERTPIGASLNWLESIGVSVSRGVWKAVSGTFAQNARGTAQAVIRSSSPRSIWNIIERPILERRGIEILLR